jgi:hypothetical protein
VLQAEPADLETHRNLSGMVFAALAASNLDCPAAIGTPDQF